MVEAVPAGGHAIGHHGYLHEKVVGPTVEQEEEILVKGIESFRRLAGRVSEGYRAPWWELNPHSPGLIRRHGFRDDSSLMGDGLALDRLIRHIQTFAGVWWTPCAQIAAFHLRHAQPQGGES